MGLVPGGQQVDVTDQPVTAAGEAQPAGRTDGCRWEGRAFESRGDLAPPTGLGLCMTGKEGREHRAYC